MSMSFPAQNRIHLTSYFIVLSKPFPLHNPDFFSLACLMVGFFYYHFGDWNAQSDLFSPHTDTWPFNISQ